MKMIKALIFDFGSVVYKTEWKKLNQFFVEKHGFSILLEEKTDEKLKEELIKIYMDSEVGREDFKKFFLKIKPELNNIDEVIRDYKKTYAKYKIVNKEILEVIEQLKKKGKRIFGFTDAKKEHYEANKEEGFYDLFEEVFASFDFGCIKSEEKAFEILTEKLKKKSLKPEDCLFIDNKLENIKRAKEKGFQTFHYDSFPNNNKLVEFFFQKQLL